MAELRHDERQCHMYPQGVPLMRYVFRQADSVPHEVSSVVEEEAV